MSQLLQWTRSDHELLVTTSTPRQTQAVGEFVAELLQAGDVLALVGDLGAGKTAFTQGVARGMGIARPATSPTFTLINQYVASGGRVLQHVDCYRLAHATAEMWDVGLPDLLAGDDVVIIEWADRVQPLLPETYLEIDFTYLDDQRRELRFVPHGGRYEGLCDRLARRMGGA